jgi:hypothetical protein
MMRLSCRLGLITALSFLAGSRPVWSDQPVTKAQASAPEPSVTREAVCRWVDQAPVIDGKLDDPAWARAAAINRFAAYWNRAEVASATRAKLVWDATALYFAAELSDTEIRAFGTRRNERLWLGDVFELFFKPATDRPEYYEFQVNPRSTILELAFPQRGFDFATLAARPPLGMEAVAVVDGTLDRPDDRDRGWTVEGRIPWSVFAPSGGRPAPGASWRFALCRYDYGPEGTEPVLMSSAPLTRPSFHRYEDYGVLRFEGTQPASNQGAAATGDAAGVSGTATPTMLSRVTKAARSSSDIASVPGGLMGRTR